MQLNARLRGETKGAIQDSIFNKRYGSADKRRLGTPKALERLLGELCWSAARVALNHFELMSAFASNTELKYQ